MKKNKLKDYLIEKMNTRRYKNSGVYKLKSGKTIFLDEYRLKYISRIKKTSISNSIKETKAYFVFSDELMEEIRIKKPDFFCVRLKETGDIYAARTTKVLELAKMSKQFGNYRNGRFIPLSEFKVLSGNVKKLSF